MSCLKCNFKLWGRDRLFLCICAVLSTMGHCSLLGLLAAIVIPEKNNVGLPASSFCQAILPWMSESCIFAGTLPWSSWLSNILTIYLCSPSSKKLLLGIFLVESAGTEHAVQTHANALLPNLLCLVVGKCQLTGIHKYAKPMRIQNDWGNCQLRLCYAVGNTTPVRHIQLSNASHPGCPFTLSPWKVKGPDRGWSIPMCMGLETRSLWHSLPW